MNETLNTIHIRRSVRVFEERQLSDGDLSLIIEAGRCAPSGGNNRTSHLIVIQNKEVLEKLRIICEQEFAKMEADENTYKSLRTSINASKKGNYRFHFDAPTLIVVANRKGYGNAMADSACLLENMMIAATSIGVGSCWINQLKWLDSNPAIREAMSDIGLLDTETICGAVALGYPKNKDPFRKLDRDGNVVTYIR